MKTLKSEAKMYERHRQSFASKTAPKFSLQTNTELTAFFVLSDQAIKSRFLRIKIIELGNICFIKTKLNSSEVRNSFNVDRMT